MMRVRATAAPLPMPPALKALLSQVAGLAIAFALARAGLVAGLWPLVGVQALGATVAATALNSARWWQIGRAHV